MAFQSANSKQIRANSITNEHIKTGTLIDEAKLNIDWATRGAAILATKLLVDFVQVNGKAVSALNNVAVTDVISAPVADVDTEKGAIVQPGKNKVIIRDNATGEPIISAAGTEVYGKLTNNGTDYIISFFAKDGANVEQAYTFGGASVIDFQFPQRFDLSTIAETFAANEKFVDGAADVSTRLDLEQIIKDAFGGSYDLNQDGAAVRAKSIVAELTEKTSGVTNTGVTASTVIDEIVTARGASADLNARLGSIDSSISTNGTAISTLQTEVTNARGTFGNLDARLDDIEGKVATEVTDRGTAIQAVRDDLASILNGKGASLVGIEDFGNDFAADDVEGALVELAGRLSDVEGITSSTEVADARDSVTTGVHASLDARLEAGETRFEAVKTEVETARGASANLNARLSGVDSAITGLDGRVDTLELNDADKEDRIVVLEGKDHAHFAEDKQVLAGDPLINTSRYDLTTGTFVAGNKSLQVFVNGFLQMVGVNYTEVTNAGGEGIAINFAPELIQANDVFQLRWHK